MRFIQFRLQNVLHWSLGTKGLVFFFKTYMYIKQQLHVVH